MANGKKSGRKPRDPNAKPVSKREKFIRLGSARMTKALKAISQLGNLSGSGYEYTEDDVKKMREAIASTLTVVFSRLGKKDGDKPSGFSFSS